jgi:type III secretory pathway component EscU
MSLFESVVLVALFVALTPGVLLRIPAAGSKLTVAVVHGLVFAFVLQLTYMYFLDDILDMMDVSEGFRRRRRNKRVEMKKEAEKIEVTSGINSRY